MREPVLTYDETMEVNKYLCDLFYKNKVFYINCWKAYEEGVKPLIVAHDKNQQPFVNQPDYSKVVFIAYNFYSNRSITLYDDDFATIDSSVLRGAISYERIYDFILLVMDHFLNKDWVKKYDEEIDIRQYLAKCKKSGVRPETHKPSDFVFSWHGSMNGMNKQFSEYDDRYFHECFIARGCELSRKDCLDVFWGRRKDISMYPYGVPTNKLGIFQKIKRFFKRWLN